MSITIRDKDAITAQLESALELAVSDNQIALPRQIIGYVENILSQIDVATSGYLNVLTCLICSSLSKDIDPRFHRSPGKGMPSPTLEDGWFSGRSVSERILYPWLNAKGLRTAKSGWQTRTYERPTPYTLDYPENIAYIKDSFLGILDYASKNFDDRIVIVAEFIRREIEHRDQLGELKKRVSKNTIGNDILIMDILGSLNDHFSVTNSAHLPVIAIHSIYDMLIEQVSQYHGFTLRPLESHQASDLRTGAVGDIEIEDADGDVVEGVEVKHGLRIGLPILMTAEEKILKSGLKRYYILTTHSSCNPSDPDVDAIIRKVYKSHGCQIIPNGVYPTIRYYLRMMSNPSEFLRRYSDNLAKRDDVTHDQVTRWIALVDGLKS